MGGWVANHVAKEVFITAPNYQAGKDQLGAFKETFVPAGGKLVGEDYPKLGETDYAPYLTKIKQSGAKAVYAFFSGTDAVNFVKQYDDFGLKQSIKLTGAGFLPKPHNVVQPFIYVREVKEVSGGLDNVPIDKIANVTDPGTGCTLPA